MRLRILVSCLALLVFVPLALPQCQAPVLATRNKSNMLTPALEYDLGEIDAEQEAVAQHLLDVRALTGHLQQIGKRIEEHLPPNEIKFRYYIVDEGAANAWALPGGRIYVTRKLISFVRREDELAAVMAHEMGHQLAHHAAIRWSRILKDSLDISSIKNRAELEDAMNRLFDSYKRKAAFPKDEDEDQLQADQVAVYAMSSAGYDPKAASEFWDRFAGLKGKKGNWLADIFGGTSSDAKRLRSFVNVAAAMPSSCVNRSLAVNTAAFATWRNAVRTYSGAGRSELLPSLAFRRQLQPALRSEISHLQFSPDGKYVLAQDEVNVFLLTREPLATLMRIDAENAYPATFSSDSKHISFYDEALRTQRWNIEAKEVEEVGEVHALRGCLQTRLSPDGKYLACVSFSSESYPLPLQLLIFNTSTSESVFVKKDFLGSVGRDNQMSLLVFVLSRIRTGGKIVTMGFSPDGRYFLAGGGNTPLAVDLTTSQEMWLPGSITKLLRMSFAFLGSDRLIGVDGMKGDKSGMVRFPSGEVLESDLEIGPLAISAPGHGDFIIARPLPKSPAGIMDLKTKQFTVGTKTNAIDIYDDVYVAERVSGEIALYRYPTPTPIATIQLGDAPMGAVRAFAISANQKYAALSERKRGAIWDLSTGERTLYVRGFRGAEFDNNSAILDFPSPDDYVPPRTRNESLRDLARDWGEEPGHSIAMMTTTGEQAVERDKFLKKTRVSMNGRYIVLVNADKPEEEWNKNVTVEVREASTGAKLWSRRFDKKPPSLNFRPDSDNLILIWDLSESAVKDEVKGDNEAKQKLDNIHAGFEGSYFIEVVDFRTGKPMGKFPIDSGNSSFKLNKAYVFGDKVFLEDSLKRVKVYSLDGKLLSRTFGLLLAASRDGNYMALSAGRGHINIFRVGAKQLLDHLVFISRVSHAEFSPDGKKFFVLTSDQALYGFNFETLSAKSIQ